MLGFENPPLCLIETCGEGYYEVFTSRCGGKKNYECLSNFYLECPKDCKTCGSATTCTECFAGYIKVNDLCEPCPDGKYWSAPQTCLGK